MPTSFIAGFICCAVMALLYLIQELVKVLKEWVLILRECLDELKDE